MLARRVFIALLEMFEVAAVLEVVCWHGEESFYCTVRDG